MKYNPKAGMTPNYVVHDDDDIVDLTTDAKIQFPETPSNYTGPPTEPYDITTQNLKPEEHTTSTLETATHSTQPDRYKEIRNRLTGTEDLHDRQVSLLDIINYLGNLDEDAKEIYALKLAEEIYKDKSLPDKEEEKITEIYTYLNLLEELGLIKPKEFRKVYEDKTKEIMMHTYQIEPEMQELLKDTYKDARSTGTDELSAPEANEVLIHYLEKNMDEFTRETWKAYT